MGVTYKLTDDVVRFILERKQEEDALSCRELVQKVGVQFQRHISKSSVHEVLKEARITSPRGRKFKSKFQIPEKKKAQLRANLPPVVPLSPSVVMDVPRPQVIPELCQPLTPSPSRHSVGEMLLKAACTDLFPRPWKGMNSLQDYEQEEFMVILQELKYRCLMAVAYKVELEDGQVYYMDSRFQVLAGQADQLPVLAAPIERVLTDLANCLLNNTQTLIIKEFMGVSLECITDFMASLTMNKGKNIGRVSVLGQGHEIMASFDGILPQKRSFIIGVGPQVFDISILTDIEDSSTQIARSYFYPEGIRFVARPFFWGNAQARAFIILNPANQPQRTILSNMPVSVCDSAVVGAYAQRHGVIEEPLPCPAPVDEGQDSFRACLKAYINSITAQPFTPSQWEELFALEGEVAYNESVVLMTVAGTGLMLDVAKAAAVINAIQAKDENKRQIFLKIK